MVELLAVIVLVATFASISVPSLSKWINNERQNTYVKEISDFIPLLIRESRRWGGTCSVKINRYIPPGKEGSGLKIDCKGIGQSTKNNIKAGPTISKHIFQEGSSDFTITPKGQIYSLSNSPIIFIVGGRNNSGRKQPKCIVFEKPVGSSRIGTYSSNYSFAKSQNGSKANTGLRSNYCK